MKRITGGERKWMFAKKCLVCSQQSKWLISHALKSLIIINNLSRWERNVQKQSVTKSQNYEQSKQQRRKCKQNSFLWTSERHISRKGINSGHEGFAFRFSLWFSAAGSLFQNSHCPSKIRKLILKNHY